MSTPRRVVWCCYLGMFIQALVINITPLLFIPLREEFGLTFEQIGRLILVNFLTQMVVDLICTALADRVHPRPLIVAANALSGIGLWIFALSPFVLKTPYSGFLFGTVVFSVGCGLLEVLLSPLVNALPTENKSGAMAMLHAFYPIGKVAVIIVTGLALFLLGPGAWPWVMLTWSILPVINTVAFLRVKLPPLADPDRRHTLRAMLAEPILYWLLAGMLLAGATEVTIAQWTSAYAETALGFPKVVADLVGFCLFGVGMIVGRLWFGLNGGKHNLSLVMWGSALLSAFACVVMAVSPSPIVALAAIGFSGVFVSMLWPGVISLSAARYPLAGASLFAILAAAGDGGGALMPWLVGVIADHSIVFRTGWMDAILGAELPPQVFGLKAAFLVTAICPLLMLPVLVAISGKVRNH
ncbi:MAG: MFS transporter [Terrimicrobiaceae bacterium]